MRYSLGSWTQSLNKQVYCASGFITGLVMTIALTCAAHAGETSHRLFIQIWWDSAAIEMDPSDDPGRLEVYIGNVFVGCAITPAHLNYRKQLMIVPPSIGLTAFGVASDIRVVAYGELNKTPGMKIKITELDAEKSG